MNLGHGGSSAGAIPQANAKPRALRSSAEILQFQEFFANLIAKAVGIESDFLGGHVICVILGLIRHFVASGGSLSATTVVIQRKDLIWLLYITIPAQVEPCPRLDTDCSETTGALEWDMPPLG